MNQKAIGIIGNGYPGINTLLAAMAIQDSRLSKEEKVAREERRRLAEEQRIRKAKVHQNICPDCDGKLIRGKKDKKFDYKRLWSCNECDHRFTDEGTSV